jgi:enoyl-CoA hydratase/carnithine racemase
VSPYNITEKLKVEIINHTALITIDNPAANTWDDESLPALKKLVETLNADRNIYSLVITGQGEKFFSAGADLNLFADGDIGVASKMARYFGEAFDTLADFRGVSIAAINGFAMGGGLETALACDIRIAEEQAQMALPEAKVGLLPCAGGSQRLSWLVSEGWAKRIILCGERVDAATALKIGLVEEVVGKGEAKDKALALAAKVEQQSPVSVTFCKELIHQARNNAMNPALPYERERFVDLFDTQDQVEGVKAFLEKRKPEWKNC